MSELDNLLEELIDIVYTETECIDDKNLKIKFQKFLQKYEITSLVSINEVKTKSLHINQTIDTVEEGATYVGVSIGNLG